MNDEPIEVSPAIEVSCADVELAAAIVKDDNCKRQISAEMDRFTNRRMTKAEHAEQLAALERLGALEDSRPQ